MSANSSGIDPSVPLPARRSAVLLGLFAAASLVVGCGGGESADNAQAASSAPPAPVPSPAPGPAPAPAPAPASAWGVGPIILTAGSGATIDMSATLPSSVSRGGTFGISASGALLPAGMNLSKSGILSVGSATVGVVSGVIFTYAEPTA